MSTLFGISGIIIALYTIYCGLGLWLAKQVCALERGEEPFFDDDGLSIYDHLPKSHIELVKHYYVGTSGTVWKIAFISLISSLFAMVFWPQYSVYLFGLALGIDCLIFITYEKRNEFLSQTSKAERVFDAVQYAILLIVFAILAIQRYNPPL